METGDVTVPQVEKKKSSKPTANVELSQRIQEGQGAAMMTDPSLDSPESRRDLATLVRDLHKEMNKGFAKLNKDMVNLEMGYAEIQDKIQHMEEYMEGAHDEGDDQMVDDDEEEVQVIETGPDMPGLGKAPEVSLEMSGPTLLPLSLPNPPPIPPGFHMPVSTGGPSFDLEYYRTKTGGLAVKTTCGPMSEAVDPRKTVFPFGVVKTSLVMPSVTEAAVSAAVERSSRRYLVERNLWEGPPESVPEPPTIPLTGNDTIDAMAAALSLGLDKPVVIETPLMALTKAQTWAMALGLMAVIGVVVGLLPALRAQRLKIVDALAGR